VGKIRSFLPNERLSLKSKFLSLRERHSRPRREERHLKIAIEENKHTNVPYISKIKIPSQDFFLSMRRKHLKIPEKENRHTNVPLTLKNELLR